MCDSHIQQEISESRNHTDNGTSRIFWNNRLPNEIVDYAAKNKVDLLIIGSNGLQGLAKIKGLGSVSRKVSEKVSCPITIIR